jgi:acyl-homoserine-lactone acylase
MREPGTGFLLKEVDCMEQASTHGKAARLLLALFLLAFSLAGAGCSKIVSCLYRDTAEEMQGTIKIPVLSEPVTVRRDAFGIPYVEARNMKDLARAIGYVNASDRLAQMIGFKLLSQGRLSEMTGPVGIDLDIYVRTLGLPRISDRLLKNMSPENMKLLEYYCEGVNAYLDERGNNLPPGLALTGYKPEAWRPVDSISLFELINLALSFNIHEEIGALSLAQAIGAEKTACLLPIYPDEPIPFDEAAKLKDVDFKKTAAASTEFNDLKYLLSSVGLGGIAASNNWALSKSRTANGASILANDTHLMLSMPSLWNMMHVKCGAYEAAGVGLAGVPAIVAGYNGHIAWGMTMVMADNQDIFLEQIKDIGGIPHYLYKGRWLPVSRRTETLAVKGKKPLQVTISETRHGPLLDAVLRKRPVNFIQPGRVDIPYGIALSWAAAGEDDKSLDAFFSLSFARSVDEASPIMKRIRAISLNMVFADRDNIAWQVTGNYPVRARGRGLMPSPGWTGEYDWTGFLDTAVLPSSKNPSLGFIGTANNRTIPRDYPYILSSSWYWPERAERIAQMAGSTDKHTYRTCMDMQNDTFSLFVPKLKDVLLKGELSRDIVREIRTWQDEKAQRKALSAMEMISRFDGNLSTASPDAPIIGAFLNCATKNIFLDELGPEDSQAWHAFLTINNASYNATCDHILIRGDESPFWDDVRSPAKETKAQIMARSLRDAYGVLESELGQDRADWRWGKLHTYTWETEAAKMSPLMGMGERLALWSLWSYFNRGPYPAPGDHSTLNVSSYFIGKDFDTWLIPAMRIIVDFGLKEPMYAMNSSGQSDNPSSAHYDDEIPEWLNGRYIAMPFSEEAVRKQYDKVLILKP